MKEVTHMTVKLKVAYQNKEFQMKKDFPHYGACH